MAINRFDSFFGKPKNWNGVNIYSPTMLEISDIGEEKFYIYLIFASFNKEKILHGLFGFNNEDYMRYESENDYDVLVSHPTILQHICDSLSFFVKKNVEFDFHGNSFCIDNVMFFNKDNYIEVIKIIQELNGSTTKEENALKPSNNKAKQMLEKMLAMSKKQENKEDYLDLKDIVSILCSAPDNGINIFNVGNLTVYQVYEQFERVNIKETHNRILPVWANGNLDKDGKLPEWITKTKL
ncbi:hypothetical protein [Paenibacillus odorifer]|uniref:hypothetical protein n=1 Tax=Paenibacillus odorifer TaxID=189426 RepID=UPI00096C78F5|nr:hypothetical protein [Paenibacillus odorifer]OMD67469.1 hypothetical protein BSK50_30295 [Paenibacillus odorifer]